MPQLDKVSFFSQYFWLCVFFFGFYIFGLKFFLPEMSRILKFRKKRLSASSTLALQGENDKVRNSAETALENLFKNLRAVFKVSSLENDKWFSNHLTKFSGKFKRGSLRYLHSIAKKSVSNNLSITAVSTEFSSKVFLSILNKRLLSAGSVGKRNYSTTPKVGSSIEGENALSSIKQKKKGVKEKLSKNSSLPSKAKKTKLVNDTSSASPKHSLVGDTNLVSQKKGKETKKKKS